MGPHSLEYLDVSSSKHLIGVAKFDPYPILVMINRSTWMVFLCFAFHGQPGGELGLSTLVNTSAWSAW